MASTEPACYAWAGLNLGIIEAPPVIEAAMQRMFGLSRVAASPAQWHATIRMTLDEDVEFLDSMPPLVRRHYDGAPTTQVPVVVQHHGDEYAIIARSEETGAYVVCAPPYQDFRIRSQVLTDRPGPLLFNAVLVPLIRDLLLRQGKVLMHAACVATSNGDGLIFIADSGGGKTTTALSLFRAGFDFVSDDLIAVFPKDGQIWVETVRKTTNLSPRTMGFFPELSALKKGGAKFQAGKLPLDPLDLYGPEGLRQAARVAAIINVRVAPKGPRLLARPAADLLQALVKSNLFATGAPVSKASLDVLWPLLEQARTYELITGFDPIGMAEALAKEARGGRFGAPARLCPRRLLCHSVKPEDMPPRPARTPLTGAATQRLTDSILGFSLEGRPVEAQSLHPLTCPQTLAQFWELMAFHRVDNHLGKFLLQSEAAGTLSSPFDPGRAVDDARAAWCTLHAAAARVGRIMGEAGLEAVFLRGPVFAQEYFPDPWLRQCRDIDVVLREENLAAAEKALLDCGYQRAGSRAEWLARGELPFSKNGVRIELHWHVYPAGVGRRLSAQDDERDWEDGHAVQLHDGEGPVTVTCLEPNRLLLSSCLHCVYEHRLDRLVRLVDLRQILRVAADTIDWDWIVAQTCGARCSPAVGYALECAHALVQAPVPPETLRRFRQRGTFVRWGALALPPCAILAGPSTPRWRRALFRRLLSISG